MKNTYAEMRAFQAGNPADVGKASDPVVEEIQMNSTEGLSTAHGVSGSGYPFGREVSGPELETSVPCCNM